MAAKKKTTVKKTKKVVGFDFYTGKDVIIFIKKKPTSKRKKKTKPNCKTMNKKATHRKSIKKKTVRKKEKAIIEKKTKKPSNVIYVVTKPRPGRTQGDWAVRGHGKIYSHHRTKEVAIKKARSIARARSATVMIQKTNGTFSKGFVPKPKKR